MNGAKQAIRLAILLVASGVISFAQQTGGNGVPGGTSAGAGATPFAGAPTGTCSSTQTAVDTTTGNYYSCNNGAWQKVGPAAGGSPTGTAGGSLAGNYPSPSLAAQAANTLLGNNTGSSAAPAALTISQVAALLGLGTAASQPTSAFDASGAASAAQAASLQKSSNLSDVASAPTARTNLGLGTAATQASSAFDTSGAASIAQAASLQKAGNLSDLASAPAARTNLGLGTAATQASTAFDASGAAATAQANAIAASASSACSNGSYACSASPAFTGTPTSPTQPISTNNTDIATTAAVAAALLAPVNGQSINPVSTYSSQTNNSYWADGFTPALYTGIGQAPIAWVSGTNSSACQEVSYSGTDYLATSFSATGATTPGTNSAVWYPLPQASSPYPTQLQCAFYWALANAGTAAFGQSNAVLHLEGQTNGGLYAINGPLVMPPNGAQVEIIGSAVGDNGTPAQIKATAAMNTMVLKPDLTVAASTPYSLRLSNVMLNGNFLANHGFEFDGAKLGLIEHVHISNMVGADYWVRLGDGGAGGNGYNYQWVVNDVQLTSSGQSAGNAASVTPVVTGGVLSLTLNSGGTYNYTAQPQVVHIWGTGATGTSNLPCTTMGTATASFTGNTVSALNVSGFSGCGGTIYVFIADQPAAAIGFFVDYVTDSSFTDIVDNGVGTTTCIEVVHSGNSFLHAHPYGCPIGIISFNQNMFVNTELDSNFIYQAQPYSKDVWSNTAFTYNRLMTGGKGFEVTNSGYFSSEGSTCSGTSQLGSGFALVTGNGGDFAHGNLAKYGSYRVLGVQCDDGSHVDALPVVTTPSLNSTTENLTTASLNLGTGATGASTFMSLEQNANIGWHNNTGNLSLDAVAGGGIEFGVNDASNSFAVSRVAGFAQSGLPYSILGSPIASAATVSPTGNGSFHVTGTTQITTITPPNDCSATGQLCKLTLIPDGLWTLGTGGNIAVARNASVGVPVELFYDPSAGLWYPLGAASATGTVASVFGRGGAVVANSGDYTVSQVTGAAPLASPTFTGTPAAPTPATSDNSTTLATTAYVKANVPSVPVTSVFTRTGAVVAGTGDYTAAQVTNAAATNASNTFGTANPQTAPAFFPQSITAGPYAQWFDDFFTNNGISAGSVGSPTGQACSTGATYLDNTAPGNILAVSGTVSGAGVTCQGTGTVYSVFNPATAPVWKWETRVLVPVLPGTTAATYQAGMVHTSGASPWTTGIGFILGNGSSTINDWYCRYSTTSTDSGVAAVASTWTRLSLFDDGTFVHWYINGTEITGCKTAVGSMPTASVLASWSSVAGTTTSVTMAMDYGLIQMNVSR